MRHTELPCGRLINSLAQENFQTPHFTVIVGNARTWTKEDNFDVKDPHSKSVHIEPQLQSIIFPNALM